MNLNKFFKVASEKGLSDVELRTNKSTSLSIAIFKGAIDNFTQSSSSKILARGIYKGKGGFCSTEKDDSSSYDYLVNGIINNSSLVESDEEVIIFEGSPKYTKWKGQYNKEIADIDVQEVLKILFSLEKKILAKDSLVSDVQLSFEYSASNGVLANSKGLKLKEDSNYYYFMGSVVMKDGEEIKSNYKVKIESQPLTSFDEDAFVEELVLKCKEKFHGVSIPSKTYKAVLSQEAVGSLLSALISNLSSEETQKHSSVYEGKVGEQVLSPRLTVLESPLVKNVFYSSFDDDGVAKTNKKLIEKGVLKTLLYNIANAKKDGVSSTGNARLKGAKTGIGFSNLVVKPGSASLEDLFAKIGDGVYVTELSGLHAGLNPKSGDFSLQAEGFLVKDGKKDSALTLITCSGNLFKMFNDIIAVGNDSKLLLSSTTTPSIAFKHLNISAE
ncbi:MAG: TldD/PmbA family protein [Bacilli bacterium]|nr:TldD/PmbA family protein [Bacilli bacterium]